MEIKIDEAVLPTVVTLHGRMMGDESQDVEQAILRLVGEPGHQVVVDLAGVDRVDSRGLGIMVNLTCRSNMSKGRLAFARPNLFVNQVIQTTQLNRFLTILEDLDRAKTAVLP